MKCDKQIANNNRSVWCMKWNRGWPPGFLARQDGQYSIGPILGSPISQDRVFFSVIFHEVSYVGYVVGSTSDRDNGWYYVVMTHEFWKNFKAEDIQAQEHSSVFDRKKMRIWGKKWFQNWSYIDLIDYQRIGRIGVVQIHCFPQTMNFILSTNSFLLLNLHKVRSVIT